MNLLPADRQRTKGRPVREHPNRVVKPLGGCKVLVQDEPDSRPYEVAFLTPAMRDAFLSRVVFLGRAEVKLDSSGS